MAGTRTNPSEDGRLRLGAIAACTAALALFGSSQAYADTTLTASYTISISGLTIGRADVRARFTEDRYAASVDGSTWGISAFVSDARARLAGSGRIRGTMVVPGSYDLDTSEDGFETLVRMTMRGGAVADVLAEPGLIKAADRVPITQRHLAGIFDPVGAFLVAVDDPANLDGRSICNRTVKVFDGWQRYDVRLAYKETRPAPAGYRGDVTVCGARYVPIAGHRPSREAVTYMANNKRLEISMALVAGSRILVPYRILIGTQAGDLLISANRFDTSGAARATSTN